MSIWASFEHGVEVEDRDEYTGEVQSIDTAWFDVASTMHSYYRIVVHGANDERMICTLDEVREIRDLLTRFIASREARAAGSSSGISGVTAEPTEAER